MSKIKIIQLAQTCYACPSQWDGLTDDNRQAYFRYRWGNLSVTLGKVDDMKEYAAVRGEPVCHLSLDNSGWGGLLLTADMMDVTSEFIDWSDCREVKTIIDWN